MRLFMYISKAVEVHRLPDVLNVSRRNNEARNLTGVLTYNHGYYLQAVEGSSSQIDQLKESLLADTRHQDINVIMDVVTDRRYFSNFLDLVSQLSKNTEFVSFINNNKAQLESCSKAIKGRMDLFFPMTQKAILLAARKVKKSKVLPVSYKVTHWPDFDIQKSDTQLLSLCAALLHNPIRYDQLLQSGIYQDESGLKMGLHELRKVGCLTIGQSKSNAVITRKIKSVPAQPADFMNRVKSFIGQGKHA